MLLLACLFVGIGLVTAQTQKVTGVVISEEDGQPVVGASVLVKGTTLGTITDVDGNFNLSNVPSSAKTLQISYIGMQTQEVVIKPTLKVVLKSDSQNLDEVVVTAMGIKRSEKSLGYAVSSVKGDEITKARESNVLNSLSGKIAGLQIAQSSGTVGGSSSIQIRGASSIGTVSSPLFIIDGLPIDNGSYNPDRTNGIVDVGNRAGDINSDDIESINVLKGAAATALYGARAKDGAIVITTKKGKKNSPVFVTVNSSTRFENVLKLPDFQNEYAQGSYGVYNVKMLNGWGPKISSVQDQQFTDYKGDKVTLKANPDNVKDFYETGMSYINNVSVAGGGEKADFRLSFTSTNQTGVVPGSDYNKYAFSVNAGMNFTKNFTGRISAQYIRSDSEGRPAQGANDSNLLIPLINGLPRTIDIHDIQKNWVDENGKQITLDPEGKSNNPYWIINRNMFNTDRDRYIMSLSMKWNITNWLNIIGRARVDNAYTDFERKLYASTDGLFAKSQGNYMNQEDKNTSTYLDFLVNIDKKFGENYHLLVNLGGSYYDEKYKSSTFEGNLLGVPNFFHPSNIPSTESGYSKQSLHTQTQSLYGKAELGYRNFLYADVTSRIDWFSTLVGTSKEYVFYPSVGLSVVLSEIIPLPKKVFSFWKIRGSYAQVGNPPSAYLPYATVVLENGNATSANFSPANHLKAEMTKAFEFGMDLRLFDNKLNLAATYYNSNTYNQLFKYELPPSTGYAFAYENAGKVNNWGIELSVGFNQDLGPVNWNSNLIYSMNRNEIKELLPEYVTDRTTSTTVKSPTEFSVASADSYRMILKEGGTMSDIYATKLKQDLHGDILISNGGVSAEENTFIKVGSAAPKYNLGFRNSFSWKGVELDFLIDARVGGEVISATQALMDQFGVSQQTATARDNGGVPVNNGKLDAEQYYGTVASGKTGLLAHYVYSATNVRLREMSLSYMLPAKWFGEKLNISLSLTGHNLLMFYKKAPFDPELTANTGTYYQGFDYFMPPSLRSFGFGVKVNF